MNGRNDPIRHILSATFFDRHERLRSGWRFFVFFSVFLLLTGLLGSLTMAMLTAMEIDTGENALLVRTGGSIISLAAALLVGWLCAKFLEKLPFRSLGASLTKGWLRDLATGIALGAFSLCLAVVVAVGFGGLRFEFNAAAGTNVLSTLAVTSLVFLFGAAFEEALVRGYMFQTLTRSGLAWLAIALTSLIFAAGHLGNEGATVFSTANTALAGVWLGIGYLKTRTLWFVTGMHFSWNWVQGSFFGIEVSGFENFAAAPLFRELDGGPIWITGGEYGLEGGFAATVAILVSTALIWFSPFLKAEEEMVRLTSPPEVRDRGGPLRQGPIEIA